MCQPAVLAQRGPFRIDFCAECAATHLHIGPVSVRLDSSAVKVLSEVLAEAIRNHERPVESAWQATAWSEPN